MPYSEGRVWASISYEYDILVLPLSWRRQEIKKEVREMAG